MDIVSFMEEWYEMVENDFCSRVVNSNTYNSHFEGAKKLCNTNNPSPGQVLYCYVNHYINDIANAHSHIDGLKGQENVPDAIWHLTLPDLNEFQINEIINFCKKANGTIKTVAGGGIGGAIGANFGFWGMIGGAILGALVGNQINKMDTTGFYKIVIDAIHFTTTALKNNNIEAVGGNLLDDAGTDNYIGFGD